MPFGGAFANLNHNHTSYNTIETAGKLTNNIKTTGYIILAAIFNEFPMLLYFAHRGLHFSINSN